MENEFVTYPLALRMKALGYDEECFAYFLNSNLQYPAWERDYSHFDEMSDINPSFKKHEYVLAPTWQSAFAWFLQNYNLWFRPDYYDEMKAYDFQGSIHELGKYSAIADIGNHKTFQEAQQAALEKLCEIVEK